MSCDWHILCETCGEKLHFDDANHRDDLMLDLIRNADALAGFAQINRELGGTYYLDINRWQVDFAWFEKHLGHAAD